jgi:hypothetical protein
MAAQARMQIEHRCRKKLTVVVCSPPLASDIKMPNLWVVYLLIMMVDRTAYKIRVCFQFLDLEGTFVFQGGRFIRGPFEKFMDSPYYSESELRGGAVTVSFSKYLPWQTMHFLQRPAHFSKTCCRPLITSKFLASELPFHGWKSTEIAWTVWRMF